MKTEEKITYYDAYGNTHMKPEAILYSYNDSGYSLTIGIPKKLNKFQQFMYKKCFGLAYREGDFFD